MYRIGLGDPTPTKSGWETQPLRNRVGRPNPYERPIGDVLHRVGRPNPYERPIGDVLHRVGRPNPYKTPNLYKRLFIAVY